MSDAEDALADALAREIAAREPFRDPGRAVVADLDAAWRVQAKLAERQAAERGGVAGRKIAWNTAPQMEAFGIDEPAAARMFRADIRETGTEWRAADFHTFAYEPEIAAILKAPLAPREGGHDRASAAAAVDRFVPAFEVLDPRGFPGPKSGHDGALGALAAGIFNRGAVVGGPGVAPEDLDPETLRSVVRVNGEQVLDKVGAAPMHPLDAVAFLANRFNRGGETPGAGELLLLGAHLPPTPLEAPARLTFTVGPLGEVTLELA